jgi:hypothetical protein
MEALSPVAGDSTLSIDLVIRGSLASTIGQLWKVTQPVARAVEYIGASETVIDVDDSSGVTAGGAVAWVNGEAVTVAGTNQKGRATIYRFDGPTYIPGIL